MTDRTCAECGAAFQGRSGGKPQRYCTKVCYSSAAAARARARSMAVPRKGLEPCAVCGALTRRFGPTVYCGDPACRRERNRRISASRQTPDVAHANYLRHKHKWRVYNARRRDRINVQTIPGSCTEEKIEARMAYWGHECWVCGGPEEERDHVKPLSKGGLHLPANLRPICRTCNRRKKDRWPFTRPVT